MQIGHGTHIGKVRETNEDAYAFGDHFVIVADGMGGHNKGEVASKMAVDTMRDYLTAKSIPPSEMLDEIVKAIQNANFEIYQKSSQNSEMLGMGTTVVAGIWNEQVLCIAHVGDSRCYRVTAKEIKQLTEDHTLVQNMVNEGKLTKEEARHHKNRNIIMRAVGTDRYVKIDSQKVRIKKNDLFLFCTDGLTNCVDESVIQETLINAENLQSACDTLISLANQGGGIDNITVVAIQF